ncbi:hypothetical protein BACT_0515 [Bifidobacterium actinocoloniiforme DSM 22766]|uniref:Uncharacterized protein n=1 Tax=Bifidobacterium actinocoloniiforme DSM 22766 TaxID=1437605 RepID=A0A086YZW5_9BIFI|nr:hypothetical protein [Bifidobacterium actinocoloniiforme]KFI39815.1 hypothetical protein BACT_0515 [Bifidobacterium actinocoloniiforme DSM 22766]
MSKFDRLYIYFCRYPSFRRALYHSDPEMWRRLDLIRQDHEEDPGNE